MTGRSASSMRRSSFASAVLAGLVVGGGAAQAQAPSAADDSVAPSVIVSRERGEEDQIRRRQEWFLGTRRAGTTSDAEMARLRAQAADETAARISVQKIDRSAGAYATNVWFPMGPAASHFGGWSFGDVSGRITALARDGARNILYTAGAAGGVWKSGNDGLSWTPLMDGTTTQTVGAIAIDPNDPDVLWAGTGDFVQGCEGYFGVGLLRSADGGLTWEPRNGSAGATLEDLSTFADIAVDPRNSAIVVVGGRIRGCSSGTEVSGGIFRTTDGGLTWSKRLADTEIHGVAQDPTNRDTWWAATGKGVYKSTDNAVTWVVQTASGLPNGNTGRTEIAIAPSASQTVYALFSSGSTGNEFWRTTNGGGSWTRMSNGSNACDGQCWYNMTLAVHPTNASIVYRGTVHIFKSLDGGASWTDLSNGWGPSQTVHQDTHDLLTDAANPEWLYVGCDGGVWKSSNGGSAFANLNGNLDLTQFYAIGMHPTDMGILCGGAQDNSSLARPGPGNVWNLQAVTGDGFVCHINPVDPSYAYITSYPNSYPQIYRSVTGPFGSFGVITGAGSGISAGDRIDWVTPYLLDPKSPNVLYLGTHRVYKSIDHGTSWTLTGASDLTGGSGDILALEINRNFTGTLYTGSTSGRVWRTGDGGASWTDITPGLPARSINDLGADPTNPDRAFAVVGGFGTAHLWEHNVGTGWVARGSGLPNVPANTVLLLTDRDVLVGNDVGVFLSTDGGVSFAPFMTGMPQGIVVTDLKFDPRTNTLTAGTYGRGAWQVTIDPVQPIILFESIELPLVEEDGDGDSNIEPGETWRVRPALMNAGGLAAEGVSARLRTLTPGITIASPDVRSYGAIASGARAFPSQPFTFSVDPGFACGGTIVFDVVDVASTTPPGSYGDRPGAFTVTVVDHYDADVVTTLLDEDFDPAPPSGWSHDKVVGPCTGQAYRDDWKIATKDAAHGPSYHLGNGPGGNYGVLNYAWLRFGGRDSTNGSGLTIPANANSARLTIAHWYTTAGSQDGAQVAIDATDDGQDTYTTLQPAVDYPGTLYGGNCNGLENKPAWSGSSGGWITSTFDLSAYVGRTVYLAWVFGSDRLAASGEGWYVDDVKVESRVRGAAVCQVTRWPGIVGTTAAFDRQGDGTIRASWPDACNLAAFPGQSYSVQAGDLDALHASGTYGHAPVGGSCALAVPATFSPGAGNEYYLVVPNSGGNREGGAGAASSGAARPQTSTTCGGRHVDACP